MRLPNLDLERECWDQGLCRVVGVDEVGIGPICGPVVAAAVLVPYYCSMVPGVRDSKTVRSAEREQLFAAIQKQALAIGVGAASVREIEQLNILRASHLAMRRALARIKSYEFALIDGRPIKDPTIGPHSCVVDGDASSYAIACASIVAKVIRDRLMTRLARRYPDYGWERNAGYGTAGHLTALAARGVTPYHRTTYAPVQAILAGDPVEVIACG